jgi:DNA-binding response OmpR family regulator
VGASGSGSRFLVVEDDDAIGRALTRIVRPYGEVALATTASDARRLLEQAGPWQAFLLDVGLPDGSGLELLADVRGAFPSTPALVLTGRTEASTINAAFDLDAHYAVKPIDESRVRRFLDGATAPPVSRHEARAEPAREPSASAGSDPLQRCIEHLRRLRSQAPDSLTRHAIGAAVADLKARTAEYGTGAVATAAEALGEDVPTLYRYAGVAERWSAAELARIVARKGSDGRPLSWSHLVVLAAVPSAATRERLMERALSDPLSVRELTVLVQRGAGAEALDGPGLRAAVLEHDLENLEQRRTRCRLELEATRGSGGATRTDPPSRKKRG